MDPGEGTSRSNRKRKQVFMILDDSDIEVELFGDQSEDDYQPSEEESASESEDEQLYNIELRPPEPRTSSPIAQDENRDIQGTPFVNSPQDDQIQVQESQASTSGSTSVWTTTGELTKFDFIRSNRFYGEVMGVEPIDYFNYFFDDDFFTLICSETNAQAQRLLAAHKRPRNEEEQNRGRVKTIQESPLGKT